MSRARYRRQTLVKEFGASGQELLAARHVTLIGGGGLGSHSADILLRMGLGSIDIVDRDVVDLSNLHRTCVFTEADIGKPKASVLRDALCAVNTTAKVKAIVREVTAENLANLTKDSDLILDGTDDIALRLAINRESVQRDVPWVYAAVEATVGVVMGILPGRTPCLQCILHQHVRNVGAAETPVLGSLPAAIAAIQCNEALKLLLGKKPSGLIIYDAWNQTLDVLDIRRDPRCPVCAGGRKRLRRRVPSA